MKPDAASPKGVQSPARPKRAAVITPYYREDAFQLRRCIDSVKAQTVPTDHYVVADGHPQDWIEGTGVQHIALRRGSRNFGNTPRSIGALAAMAHDYDAICFIDADNWIDPDHVETCFAAASAAKGADYVIARRRFVRMDGSALDYDDEPSDMHVDTNCFFLLPSAFRMAPLWALTPNELTIICDRIFYLGLRSAGLKAVETDKITVNYLATHKHFFQHLGEEVPPYAKELDHSDMCAWIESLSEEEQDMLARRMGFTVDIKPGIKNGFVVEGGPLTDTAPFGTSFRIGVDPAIARAGKPVDCKDEVVAAAQ